MFGDYKKTIAGNYTTNPLDHFVSEEFFRGFFFLRPNKEGISLQKLLHSHCSFQVPATVASFSDSGT